MIIKCPECGRQVSEKAPTCPSCGVEIAGKITRCKECGEVYFTEDGICPACQTPNTAANAVPRPVVQNKPANNPAFVNPAVSADTPHADATKQNDENVSTEGSNKKRNNTTLIIAFIFAVIVCGALFYLYSKEQNNKESEDYEFAMRSTDPEVLQSYLLRYGDAPAEHRDSIQAHLLLLQKGDEEWQNAVLSNSRSALQQYLDKNPDTVHRQEALNKIDSLDWLVASKSEKQDAIEEYLKMHADGRYIDDANELLDKLKRTTVQPIEREMVSTVFRKFFQSINSRDENSLIQTVGMVLNTFLGKQNATSDDVVTFMNKIYKEGITNMNWHIDTQSYKIDKHEIIEGEYEYTVTFNASKEVDHSGNISSESYRINATVTSDGKISGFNLTKLN